MQNKLLVGVERNKAVSKACKQLFPAWCNPPTQGEFQKIIFECWQKDLNNEQISAAGNWWLWMRELFIENTITKKQKEVLMHAAVSAASGEKPITLVSARSPELLHAQVENQGDKTLPRSFKALTKLKKLSSESERFLPTTVIVIFADRAIDNFKNINEVCDVEATIKENIQKLKEIAQQIGIRNFEIVRISELSGPNGLLGNCLEFDGSPKVPINLDQKSQSLINMVGKESIQSHMNMFGWSESESLTHTTNIGITMGLVGKSIKSVNPNAILIHNEAFIARGVLNNLFNTADDPLAVIALRDLLETKRSKE